MSSNESEEVSFVDDVFGGDVMNDDHSQNATDDADTELENDDEESEAENKDSKVPGKKQDSTDDDEFDDDDDEEENSDADPKKDKKPQEKEQTAPEKDPEELKQEVANLQKRLHDTQAAMHKATTERAALQKELDELKAKKENEEKWFSDADSAREKELEDGLKKADAEIARQQAEQDDLKGKEAASAWDAAAAPVIKEHPDFEKVVYEQFTPLLDAKNGNQQVIKAFAELKDKSPASVYQFAKDQLDILEFQKDPKAYKENLLKAHKNKPPEDTDDDEDDDDDDDIPRGKDGLDMLNSEDISSPHHRGGGAVDFIDEVFPPA